MVTTADGRAAPLHPFAEQGPADGQYPNRLQREAFYPVAYRWMRFSRRMDERLFELFQKGYAKGTVTTGIGNEATSVGLAMPLRAGLDVVSVLHRDLASHLILGAKPYDIFCQYLANAESLTHAREGNAITAPPCAFPKSPTSAKCSASSSSPGRAARTPSRVRGDRDPTEGQQRGVPRIAQRGSVRCGDWLIENNHYASDADQRPFTLPPLSDRAAGYAIEGARSTARP